LSASCVSDPSNRQAHLSLLPTRRHAVPPSGCADFKNSAPLSVHRFPSELRSAFETFRVERFAASATRMTWRDISHDSIHDTRIPMTSIVHT